MPWTQHCPSLTRCSTVSETTTLTTLQRQHAAVVADIQTFRRRFYFRNLDLLDRSTADKVQGMLLAMMGAPHPPAPHLLDEVQALFERNTGLTGI